MLPLVLQRYNKKMTYANLYAIFLNLCRNRGIIKYLFPPNARLYQVLHDGEGLPL